MSTGLGWAIGLTCSGLAIGGAIVASKLNEHDEKIAKLGQAVVYETEALKGLAKLEAINATEIEDLKKKLE